MKLKPGSKGAGHPYDAVESITKFILTDHLLKERVTVIRVWREQEDMKPTRLSNMDLYDAIKDMSPMYRREIAEKIAAMPRVNAVEVSPYECVGDPERGVEWSDGIILYVNWP